MQPRITRVRDPGADYQIHIVGESHAPLRDFYHALLRRPWGVTLAAIAASFLVANALFALGYLTVAHGGIANARVGSFADAFFFSVQTMGTIGYGAMFPTTFAANVLMVAESITGLALAAMWTGLVFAKFSRSTARLVFSDRVVISPVGGMPTLMFRIGNQRRNQIIDARIRVVMIRTERTDDGGTFYRMLDLKLTRERALSLSRSWSVVHVIDDSSPLHRESPDSLAAKEVEVQVLVLGIDDILMQTVHAQHRYFAKQIVFGARHADVLTERPDGDLLLDLRRFNDIEPTRPTDAFPYPEDPAARRE